MGIALLDSNTVIGFLDADDRLHRVADAAVRAAATEHVFAVSVVTVAELLTGASWATMTSGRYAVSSP
jgi:PIN domain nuclease of toxin-antitoxin system